MPEKLNRVMVFGSAARSDEDGSLYLSHVGIARAEKALEHFFSEDFDERSSESYILCAGGYGRRLVVDSEVPDRECREGRLMANYLIRRGVPERLMVVEDESTNTVENWHHSMERYGDIVSPGNFTEAEPLTLISHPNHLQRARRIGELFGFRAAHMVLLPTDQPDNPMAEKAAIERTLAQYQDYFARLAV